MTVSQKCLKYTFLKMNNLVIEISSSVNLEMQNDIKIFNFSDQIIETIL